MISAANLFMGRDITLPTPCGAVEMRRSHSVDRALRKVGRPLTIGPTRNNYYPNLCREEIVT